MDPASSVILKLFCEAHCAPWVIRGSVPSFCNVG